VAELLSGTFYLEGHIDVPTERIAQVREALAEHIKLTRAEAGCIYFSVDPCPDVEGRFLVSETFIDEAAFKFHQERAGSSPWAEASKDVPRDYRTWLVG